MGNNWITELVCFYFWIDHPYNLFPSMHLSASFFAAFYCMRKGRIIGWITMIMAMIVGVSVVLLKQHYIMDIVAGFTVAWFCSFFSLKKIKSRFLSEASWRRVQRSMKRKPNYPIPINRNWKLSLVQSTQGFPIAFGYWELSQERSDAGQRNKRLGVMMRDTIHCCHVIARWLLAGVAISL